MLNLVRPREQDAKPVAAPTAYIQQEQQVKIGLSCDVTKGTNARVVRTPHQRPPAICGTA